MPGFTIKIDTSQFVKAADTANKKAEKLGATLKILPKDSDAVSDSLSGIARAANASTQGFGKLAAKITALVGAYRSLQELLSFLQRGMNFNSSIEASEISIASIISATNKLSDAQGKVLEGAEKFNAAQSLSKEIMEEIQVLALNSTATFESLADGVSGIIAPATKAGVELEKMPKFAVAAAQAMTTMKIPIEQMRTEIEAVLTGNINRAQDQLATNLGITKEMVTAWKEQGVLVDELMKKFDSFVIAGDKVADSWAGLKGNMEDALDYLSGSTGKGIFEGAKQSYRELLSLLVSSNGKVGVGENIENIVSLVKELQDAIGGELVEATEFFIDKIKELNQPENIANLKSNFEFAGRVISDAADAAHGLYSEIKNIWDMLPDDAQYAAAGGIIGYKLFGPAGAIAGILTGVAKGLGTILEAAQRAAGLGDKDITTVDWENGDFTDPENALAAYKEVTGEADKELQAAITSLKEMGKVYDYTSSEFVGPVKPQSNINITPAITNKEDKKNNNTSITNSLEKIQRLREEIDKLNGTSSGDGLSKKLREIEKIGKSANLSSSQVESLKKSYSDAFQKNTLEEFNRQLVSAKGNTEELKNLTISDTIRDWTNRLKEAGLSTEEATSKAKELGQAMRESVDVQNLETVNDVLKELEEKTGQYGLSIESSNRLIEQQVKLWRQAGVPEEYIEQLKQIKELENSRDGWAGAWLGTKEYFSDATDLAEGFKSATVNAFSSMEDAITTACTTGKVSFSDMITSMTNDIIRLMVRTNVTGPLASALGGSISSIFGGGSYLSTANSLAGMIPGMAGIAHHGWESVGSNSPSDGYRSVPMGIFAGAPRFHSGTGYIGPGEYPAILRRGERVLNPQETQQYQSNKINNTPVVNVNVVNSTGQQASTRTSTDSMGNKTIDVYVGDMAAKQMNTPGTTLNRAVSAQTGQTRRAIRR